MAVPKFTAFMKPILEAAAERPTCTIADAVTLMADRMNLSEEDKAERLPSNVQTKVYSRVTWAITYLTKSKLLVKPSRGCFQIALSKTPEPSLIEARRGRHD